METNAQLPDDSTANNDSDNGSFTELLQEAFVLRIVGLENKEIATLMNYKDEKGVGQLICRVLDHNELEGDVRSIEVAIAIAMNNGFAKCLFEKYRHKHGKYIERFERKKFKSKVQNLPCWKGAE
jgi:hypothetical protein